MSILESKVVLHSFPPFTRKTKYAEPSLCPVNDSM